VILAKSPASAPGNLGTAVVTFIVNGVKVPTSCDNKTALNPVWYANHTVDLKTSLSADLDVTWEISGNYKSGSSCSETRTVVTVSSLANDFATGGGYIMNTGSTGTVGINGGTASKNNFGFNVKWNKSMSTLQGNFNTIIRVGSRVYQVKSNKASYLSVATDKKTATINYANAVLQEVSSMVNGVCTNPSNIFAGSCSEGGATVVLKIVDNGEPGTLDQISITVKDKNGKLFYNNSVKTLVGGNIQVRTTTAITTTATARQSVAAAQSAETTAAFTVNAYPNPFADKVNVSISSEITGDVAITVVDGKGRTVTRQVAQAAQQGPRTVEMDLSGEPHGVYLLHVQSSAKREVIKVFKMNR
jgi:hypothetical protein